MSYSKTTWTGNTPINTTNLNKIENELEAVDKSLKYIGNAPSDLNEATTNGIYHLSGEKTNAPISTAIYGILLVYQNKGETWTPSGSSGGSSWIWQEIRTTGGDIWVRNAVNTTSSWTDWEKIMKEEATSWHDATINSTLLSDGVAIYCRINNLCIVQIQNLITDNDISTHGTVMVSGLPNAIRNTTHILNRYNDATHPTVRVGINTSGNIYVHYDTLRAGDKQYYGQIVYLCE